MNDYEEDSKKILDQLVDIGNEDRDKIFLLMHMAEIEFKEAKFISISTRNDKQCYNKQPICNNEHYNILYGFSGY